MLFRINWIRKVAVILLRYQASKFITDKFTNFLEAKMQDRLIFGINFIPICLRLCLWHFIFYETKILARRMVFIYCFLHTSRIDYSIFERPPSSPHIHPSSPLKFFHSFWLSNSYRMLALFRSYSSYIYIYMYTYVGTHIVVPMRSTFIEVI